MLTNRLAPSCAGSFRGPGVAAGAKAPGAPWLSGPRGPGCAASLLVGGRGTPGERSPRQVPLGGPCATFSSLHPTSLPHLLMHHLLHPLLAPPPPRASSRTRAARQGGQRMCLG